MSGFRVTKYNPQLRDADGAYLRSEWTAVSDIGRAFEGRILQAKEYLRVESSYVSAVRIFLATSGVTWLRVTELERYGITEKKLVGNSTEVKRHYQNVSDGRVVRGDDLDWVVRLVLREAIWCILRGDNGFYVQFGYDYYMFVGAEHLRDVPPPMPDGMFAERYDWAWLRK